MGCVVPKEESEHYVQAAKVAAKTEAAGRTSVGFRMPPRSLGNRTRDDAAASIVDKKTLDLFKRPGVHAQCTCNAHEYTRMHTRAMDTNA